MDLILNAEKTNRHIKVAKAQKRDSVVRTWTLYWADQSHILILQLKNSHRRWRKMTRRQQKRYVQMLTMKKLSKCLIVVGDSGGVWWN